jgi:hypothetical protein
MLRRIFGPKGKGIMTGCTKLHDEELHNLYSSPNIMKVSESTKVRREGHVARVGNMK